MGGYSNYFYNGVYDEGINDAKREDIGYSIINKTFHYVLDNFYIFSAIISFLFICIYSKFIRRYSPYPILSLFLFAIVAYLYGFFLVRQCLATVVVLLGYKSLLEGKKMLFFVFVLFAASIHNTAILALPVYFVYTYFKNTRKWRVGLYVGTILFMLLFNFIANRIFASYDYYAHYLSSEAETSMPRIIMKLSMCLLYIWSLKKDVYKKDIRFLLLICFIMNLVIYIGCNGIYGAYRMRFFFEISEIIGIPMIIYYARNINKQNMNIKCLLCVLYIILLCVSANNFLMSDNMNSGYKSFFYFEK
jgi:hypothetical protein